MKNHHEHKCFFPASAAFQRATNVLLLSCQWNPTKFLTFNYVFNHNNAANLYSDIILGDNFMPPLATLKYKGVI